jgi:nitrite reductase (NADH) large subunit
MPVSRGSAVTFDVFICAMPRIVVVGNGMVGHRFCEALVEAVGGTTPWLSIFAEEDRPAYDRVNLGDVLHGRAPDSLTLSPVSWYEAHGIDLALGDPIVAIDRQRRVVRARSGAEAGYDRLVLATGSRPARPGAMFCAGARVFTVRTLADVAGLGAAVCAAERVVVVGGGFIGVEVAETLRALGRRVDLVETAAHILRPRLDCETARAVEAALGERGIRLHLAAEVVRLQRQAEQMRLELSTGAVLDADVVVVCAGVRPCDELADQCGLVRAARGGIRVNHFLETSDPHIYAIGECAVLDDAPATQVLPGFRMAEALALTVLGERTAFEPPVERVRLRVPGLELTLVGDTRGLDATSSSYSSGDAPRHIWVRGGRIVGATALHGWPRLAEVEDAIRTRARVGAADLRRFRWSGNLGSAEPRQPCALDATIVCRCRKITVGQIRAAVGRGCADAAAVRGQTGASGVCGSCLPEVEALVRAPLSAIAPARREPGVVVAACVGAGAAAAIVVRGLLSNRGIPYGSSLVSPRPWELLWLTRTGHLASGFTLLALLLAPGLLSARKRLRRFRWGTMTAWRLAHVLTGLLAMGALTAHTGLHFEPSLNRTLALGCALLLLAGGLTGATPVPRTASGGFARARERFRTAHIALLWPVLALLVVHVVVAFYF